MSLATGIVLALVLLLGVLAVRRIRKKKLLFSCGGDCANCAGACRRAASGRFHFRKSL